MATHHDTWSLFAPFQQPPSSCDVLTLTISMEEREREGVLYSFALIKVGWNYLRRAGFTLVVFHTEEEAYLSISTTEYRL